MKKLLIILILAGSLQAQIYAPEPTKDPKRFDLTQVAGATVGTLLSQRVFEMSWEKSAALTLYVGTLIQIRNKRLYGRFNGTDLFFNFIGVLWSYPLRYENYSVNIDKNKINLKIKF